MKKILKILILSVVISGMTVLTGCSAVVTKSDVKNIKSDIEWEYVENTKYVEEIYELSELVKKYNSEDYNEYTTKDAFEMYSEKGSYSFACSDYLIYSLNIIENKTFLDELIEMGYEDAGNYLKEYMSKDHKYASSEIIDKGVKFYVEKDEALYVETKMSGVILPEKFADVIKKYALDDSIVSGVAFGGEKDLLELESARNGYKNAFSKKVKVYFDNIDKSDVPEKIKIDMSKGEGKVFEIDGADIKKFLINMGGEEEKVNEFVDKLSTDDLGKHGKIEGKKEISWSFKKNKGKTYCLIFER